MGRRLIITILVAIFLLTSAGGALLHLARQRLVRWSQTPLPIKDPIAITLERGTTLRTISQKLELARVISDDHWFELWVRLFSSYERFQAGPYSFQGKVTPQDIARTMINGETFMPIVLQITIPEGFTLKQVATTLAGAGVGSETEFRALAQNREYLQSHRITANTLEGYLFPATYRFTSVPSLQDAVDLMINEFWKRLPVNFETKLNEDGYSLYDGIIIASLIELETPHHDERPLISEVIWRRLKAGMALGIDAAIIYGIPDYDGNLRFRHLRDETNPYNTRRHRGLPPSPICSPSQQSLLAVLNPTAQGLWYYVLDPSKPGGNRHHFSASSREHSQYVAKLRRWQRKQLNQ